MTDFCRRGNVRRVSCAGWIATLMLALGLPTAAHAQSPQQSVPKSAAPSPEPVIVCDERDHDFGVVTNVKSVSHAFRIRNDGDAELIIKKVKTSCGCTTAKLATNTIAPGQEVVLETKLSLKGRKDHQSKAISVKSNDPVKPSYRLSLKCFVQTDVSRKPENFNFRVTPENLNTQQEMVVTFSTGKPTQIIGFETNQAAFCSFTLTESIAGREYRLRAKLRPDSFETSDNQQGKILLRTDYALEPVIAITVFARYIRDVVIAPQQIFLVISTNSPKPMVRPVIVKNRTATPAEIVSIDMPPAVSVTTQVISVVAQKLNFHFENPSADLVDKEIKVRVRRDPDKHYDFTIPLHVTISPK